MKLKASGADKKQSNVAVSKRLEENVEVHVQLFFIAHFGAVSFKIEMLCLSKIPTLARLTMTYKYVVLQNLNMLSYEKYPVNLFHILAFGIEGLRFFVLRAEATKNSRKSLRVHLPRFFITQQRRPT